MQKFLSKNLTKKILLVLVVAILCNFIVPNFSHASDWDPLSGPVRWLLSYMADGVVSLVNMCFTGTWVGAAAARAVGTADGWKDRWAENQAWAGGGEIEWPTILISPEEIFKGQVLALKVNFLEDPDDMLKEGTLLQLKDGDQVTGESNVRDKVYAGKETTTDIGKLRSNIAKWYLFIRNISAAALFCVLIYIGIRVLMSSVSEERAKYKSMIMNWLVAMCLVFFLHYIMSAIMFITDKSVELIGRGVKNQYTVYQPGTTKTEPFKITGVVKAGKMTDEDVTIENVTTVYNLMEYVRLYVDSEEVRNAISDIYLCI